MNEFVFAPATRESAMARIALQGPGGSGKTKTALLMAEELAQGGLVGLIDTERESAKKYAPVPGRPHLGGHVFSHLPMSVCTPENFLQAIAAAKKAGVYVLVVDSWSHFWAGKGGLLARVDQESKKGDHRGGKFTAWGPVNDLEQDMLDALLSFPGHVICTMRTKNDYDLTDGKVTKIGVKTVQRDGAEYEFDVVVDMVRGTGTVTKTRYEPLDDLSVHHPGHEFAATILEQLGQGVDPVQVIVDGLTAYGIELDDVLNFQAEAVRRNFLLTVVEHPEDETPVTLGELLTEALGQAVKDLLADVSTTPENLRTLHRRAVAGQWIDLPTFDHQSSEMTPIRELIAARGRALAAATAEGSAGPEQGDSDQVDEAQTADAERFERTDDDLYIALKCGNAEVEAAAAAELTERGLMPISPDDRLTDDEPVDDGAGDAEQYGAEGEDWASGREAGAMGEAEPVAGSKVPDEEAPAASTPAAAPVADVEPDRNPAEPISAPQMRKIFAMFRELGFAEDRDRRLTAVSLMIGRKVTTMNALSSGEGSKLIETVAAFLGDGVDDGPARLREHLNELLAAAQRASGSAAA